MSTIAFKNYTDKSAGKLAPRPGDFVELNVVVDGKERVNNIVLLSGRSKKSRVLRGRLLGCRVEASHKEWCEEKLADKLITWRFCTRQEEVLERVPGSNECAIAWRVLIKRSDDFDAKVVEEFSEKDQIFFKEEFDKLNRYLDDQEEEPAPSPKAVIYMIHFYLVRLVRWLLVIGFCSTNSFRHVGLGGVGGAGCFCGSVLCLCFMFLICVLLVRSVCFLCFVVHVFVSRVGSFLGVFSLHRQAQLLNQ